MVVRLDTHELKARLSTYIGRVAFGRERLIVLRRGKPVAALVSIEDLQHLQDCETRSDNPAAAKEHPLTKVAGMWSDREDLDQLLDEIYADRSKPGRDVPPWD